ncbi:hypothetical protein LCGC14_2721030 [marine sediment metagenome]|uniref:Uncharacterized protein n=1 Tax=marine sediment metagenome TaxID=412755 RepID=A0A0F8ZXR3_9ZZZZ
MSQIALIYVDRQMERDENYKRRQKMMKKTTFCSKLKLYMIDFYNSFQKYIHCEIIFLSEQNKNNNINCLAFAAFEDQGVVKTQRTISNPSYCYIFLKVSKKQYDNAKKFCEYQVGKNYDSQSASWRLLVWPIRKSINNTWWCASFVHACLQKIDLLKYYQINTLDVDDIVSLVKEHPERILDIGFTPYQMKIASDATLGDLFDVK